MILADNMKEHKCARRFFRKKQQKKIKQFGILRVPGQSTLENIEHLRYHK